MLQSRQRISSRLWLLFVGSCSPLWLVADEARIASIASECNPVRATDEKPTQQIEINSLDDLNRLFKSHRYTNEAWQSGLRQVPRLVFDDVPETWQQSSEKLPVAQKKEIFFRLMAPLILKANENILALRELAKCLPQDSPQLVALALQYKVFEEVQIPVTSLQREALIDRLDIVPPSLALAQAAQESGWATSRFTLEGNAFFGQWDYSGKGMVPRQQRKELGNYGIKKFATPLESVESYMRNINISYAYNKLRLLRASLRKDGLPITGLALATTLDMYSERRQAYVDEIQGLIRYNQLQQVDDAYLAPQPVIHLIRRQKADK